jgi:hypothetical protein
MRSKTYPVLMLVSTLCLSILACHLPALASQSVEFQATSVALTAEAYRIEIVAGEEAVQEPGATPTPDTGEAVGEEIAATATPTTTPTITPTPTEEPCTNRAGFISDVTIPDGSEVDPGSSFTKTWRLRNDGTCTWTLSYDMIFSHGDVMEGPATVPFAGSAPPGSMVDFSVDLVAPDDPGTYIGNWMLRSDLGAQFGVGSGGTVAFWVEIVVPSPVIEVVIPPIQFEAIPLLLLYKSSGTSVNIHDDTCFDLDDGIGIGCGAGEADFKYDHTMILFMHHFRIDPRHGARFRLFGGSQPTSEQCQAVSLSTSEFELEEKYYCYQTSAGKYGWLKVKGFNPTAVLFDYGTFNLP